MCIARTVSDFEIFVIANENASAGHWRAQVAVTHPPRAMQVQLLPDAIGYRPVLLAVQDAGPSCRQRGFKSRTGHFWVLDSQMEGIFNAERGSERKLE